MTNTKAITDWPQANQQFKKAIKKNKEYHQIMDDTRKTELLAEVVELFNGVLKFISEQEDKKGYEHRNRIAKLHILINKCIVYNALPTGVECFKANHDQCDALVTKLNKLLLGRNYFSSGNFVLNELPKIYKENSTYHTLKPETLWMIGRINYRLHNFEEAKLFLSEAAPGITINNTKDNFNVYALWAYACEYSGHPSEAIKVLLGENNPIFMLPFCTKSGIKKGSLGHLGYCPNCCAGTECLCAEDVESQFEALKNFIPATNSEDVKRQVFDFIINGETKKLFAPYEEYLTTNKYGSCEKCELIVLGGYESEQCKHKGSKNCRGTQIKELEEVIHILAHSISEYSSKILADEVDGKKVDPNDYRNFRLKMYLHNLANRLMDSLSYYPFVCCKSMVKAEAELSQEALTTIHEDKAKPDGVTVGEWDGFVAERAFFRWYFSQLFSKEMVANSEGKTPQQVFSDYAVRVGSADSDALMHVALMELRETIKQFRKKRMYGKTNDLYDQLSQKYINLVNHRCSERVNSEIRAEYNKFKCIAEILLSYSPENEEDKIPNKLLNYAYPFLLGTDKVTALETLIRDAYVFKKYYFIFPVQYTGSLEYQMADIGGLIEYPSEIYDNKNPNRRELKFETKASNINVIFKRIDIIKDEYNIKDDIVLILYYYGGECFEFRRSGDTAIDAMSQKGFYMAPSIWTSLVKNVSADELLYMFQYEPLDKEREYRKNEYLFGCSGTVIAIIVTKNSIETSPDHSEFIIELRDDNIRDNEGVAVKGISGDAIGVDSTRKNKYVGGDE